MLLHEALADRGLFAQCTDPQADRRFAKPVTVYCGFDPTADSLHVGSLVPIMGLAWARKFGHTPIVLVGGGTGLVGDPSGKSEARKMLTVEDVNHNGRRIGAQIARVFENAGLGDGSSNGGGFTLANNADWLAGKGWIEMLREVGARISVNRMVGMDSVKNRLHSEDGISFLEFSYMLMQAYDFLHLFRTHNCTVQMGGQDQWGNIVMGLELGRKTCDADLCGLTFPLVTKSDGGKFGKSERGNIWLDAARTSVFDFYQFWRNTPDADVAKYLGYFTFLPADEVRRLGALKDAAINEAKKILAYEVTRLVHGEAEAQKAADAAASAFTGAHGATAEGVPSAPLPAAELAAGVGLIALLVRANLAKSNSEARKHIEGGGVKLGGEKQTDPKRVVTAADAKDRHLVLQFGKRVFRFDVA